IVRVKPLAGLCWFDVAKLLAQGVNAVGQPPEQQSCRVVSLSVLEDEMAATHLPYQHEKAVEIGAVVKASCLNLRKHSAHQVHRGDALALQSAESVQVQRVIPNGTIQGR